MKNDTDDKSQRAGSPDRKTRVKGDRVFHTTKGGIYHGDAADRPRGLTTEQAEEQRVGTKIGERQVREAAHGVGQATAWGDTSARQAIPGERLDGTDEIAEAPYGKKGGRQSK